MSRLGLPLHDLQFVMTIITPILTMLISLLSVLVKASVMFPKVFLKRIDHMAVKHDVLHVTLNYGPLLP